MKKLLLLLVLALFAAACDNDLFEDMPVPDEITAVDQLTATPMATRATASEADFDPINELVNNKVPLNIIAFANTKNKYLGYSDSGTSVYLKPLDSESEYTRWILTKPIGNMHRTLYCAARYDGNNIYAIAPKDVFSKGSTDAVLKSVNQPQMLADYTGNLYVVPNTKHYRFFHYYTDPDDVMKDKTLLLQSENLYGTKVIYSSDLQTTRAYWDISPAGKYTVSEIKYVETGDDGSIPEVEYGRTTTLNNPSAATASHTVKFYEKSLVSSTIKDPNSITIETMGQVAQPNYDSVGMLTSVSSGTVGNMEFGSTTSYEKTIGDETTITVPPYTSVNVEATRQVYTVKATYIATVISQIYGIKFRIKGTYEGRLFTRIIINIKNNADGSIIETKSISNEIK